MVRTLLEKSTIFARRHGVWLAPLTGLSYALCQPPFSHETHPLLAPFPLLSFVILLPFMAFAAGGRTRRAALLAFLYGFTASLVQYYWIGFVTAEGVWHLIIIGTGLLCCWYGAYFLAAAMLFRAALRFFPRLFVALFPAVWVLIDYSRSLGDLSFPWALIGYSLTPLPTSQAASVCGVVGLGYLVVMGNSVIFAWLRAIKRGEPSPSVRAQAIVYGAVLAAVTGWGAVRLATTRTPGPSATFSCIQAWIDQTHWGNRSLDTSFAVIESLATRAAQDRPDCIVTAESAFLCYLQRQPMLRRRILRLSETVGRPMVVGALHWDPAPTASAYDYLVYNAAFLIDSGASDLKPYYKMKLVPFSEVMPFEGVFPVLSRVNLGEADFKAGRDPVTFSIGERIRGVPLICYEVIYPDFVRTRTAGANVIINITNDGWFGRTSGPFHHAAMARMRCIEEGISMVRCANSGISMLVDPVGRVIGKTGLYTRVLLTGSVPLQRVPTLYARLGDWVVWVCVALVVAGLAVAVARKIGASRRPKSG